MSKCLALLCVSAVLATATVRAAEKPARAERPSTPSGVAPDGGDRAKRQSKPPLGFTPEREAAAVEFVRRHHPELAALLGRLKKSEPAEYRRAVSALFRASERLAHVQERDADEYDRELKAWKLKSRIQLLVARIRMAPDDGELRRELEQALSEQLDVRRERLAAERRKLVERLKKLEAQIKEVEVEKQREQEVQRQLDLLLRDKKKHNVQGKTERGKTPAGAKPAAGAKPNFRAAGAPEVPKKPLPASNVPPPLDPPTKPAP